MPQLLTSISHQGWANLDLIQKRECQNESAKILHPLFLSGMAVLALWFCSFVCFRCYVFGGQDQLEIGKFSLVIESKQIPLPFMLFLFAVITRLSC